MRYAAWTTRCSLVLATVGAAVLAGPLQGAIKISDITHLQGSRGNRLTGWGLVVGLSGSGDGKHSPTLVALAQLHKQFANPVTDIEDLKNVKNVAIVSVEAMMPSEGAREGEAIDVMVSSVGAAKSLAGGRLLLTPLVGPNPDDDRGILALASGPLEIRNEELPTVGRVAGGAIMERDWVHNYMVFGRELAAYQQRTSVRPMDWLRPDEAYISFVLDNAHAKWAWAYTIAQAINEEASISELSVGDTGSQIAMPIDPRTVVVRVPEAERMNVAAFIARLERLQLFMPFTEASVTISRRAGTIVMDSEVEFTPGIISHGGLSIAPTLPLEESGGQQPKRVVETSFVPIDPNHKATARLSDLIEALSQLGVPVEDRITIIELLHENGQLHAKLRVDD